MASIPPSLTSRDHVRSTTNRHVTLQVLTILPFCLESAKTITGIRTANGKHYLVWLLLFKGNSNRFVLTTAKHPSQPKIGSFSSHPAFVDAIANTKRWSREVFSILLRSLIYVSVLHISCEMFCSVVWLVIGLVLFLRGYGPRL